MLLCCSRAPCTGNKETEREAAIRSFSKQLKTLDVFRKDLVSPPGNYSEGIISVVGKLRCQRAISKELVELP